MASWELGLSNSDAQYSIMANSFPFRPFEDLFLPEPAGFLSSPRLVRLQQLFPVGLRLFLVPECYGVSRWLLFFISITLQVEAWPFVPVVAALR